MPDPVSAAARQDPGVDPIRVAVVDAHQAFGDALLARLRYEPDIEVVGVAATGRSAMALVATLRPDVVTLDAWLGAEDGLDVCAQMLRLVPDLHVVVVTEEDSAARAVEAVLAGASSWVAMDSGLPALLDAIRGATRGHSRFPPHLLGQMLPELVRAGRQEQVDDRLAGLTDREREILQCMVDGLDRRGIAQRLVLSVNTVRTHAQSVLAKLGVHSSLEAAAVGLSAGMRSRSAAADGAGRSSPA
jgi:DNA-binding NarL/FixJ family response regulator